MTAFSLLGVRMMMLCGSLATATILILGAAPVSAQGMMQENMPVLTGDTWQQMSQAEKMSFIWGIAHVVDFERNLRSRIQSDVGKSAGGTLIPYIEQALRGRTFGEVIAEVDVYYAGGPGRSDRPVLSALVTEAR